MDVLDSILFCISSEIKVNRIGEYMKNSKCNDDYDIVKWDSFPCTIQKGQEEPDNKSEDIVVTRIKINPIVNTIGWFVIGKKFKSNSTRFYMET